MADIRSVHTYALLPISRAAFAEIKAKLEAAGYQDQFHEDSRGEVLIDMYGIALKDEEFPTAPDFRIVGKDSGAAMIVDERLRQISKEGFSPEHDDAHAMGEMAAAAMCYAELAVDEEIRSVRQPMVNNPPEWWPWETEWWKPSPDPIKNLKRAGALLAAEIDRLLRAKRREELEAKKRQDAIDELKKQPVSDPEKFVRCSWCGMEMEKIAPEITIAICNDCLPF